MTVGHAANQPALSKRREPVPGVLPRTVMRHWPWSEDEVDAELQRAGRVAMAVRVQALETDDDHALLQLLDQVRRLCAVPMAMFGAIGDGPLGTKLVLAKAPQRTGSLQIDGRSFCHYVHACRQVVVIDDVRAEPEPWRSVQTLSSFDVRAYIGVPVMVDGEVVGTLAVADVQPRSWQPQQVDAVRALAESLQRELRLRLALSSSRLLAEDRRALVHFTERAIAGLAHGIRTPLMVVQLCASTAASWDTPQAAQLAARLHRAAVDIRRLSDELQMVSVLREDDEAFEPLSTASVVGLVLQMFKEPASRLAIDLHQQVRGVGTASGKLSEVLLALACVVDNALRYNRPDGVVRMRDRLVPGRDGQPDRLEIVVANTGAGFTDEQLSRWRSSMRASVSGRATVGSGLGLSIAADVMRRHGGWLQLRSRAGHGARVTLSFPVGGAVVAPQLARAGSA